MPRFALNLNYFFPDLPLARRFAAAADLGFSRVELLFPYDDTPEAVRGILDFHNLELVLFDAPGGRWNEGERGLGALAGRDDEFAESVQTALRYAVALGCGRVNVLSGIHAGGEARDRAEDRLVERLRHAADVFRPHGVTLLVEHINPYDIPGFFLGAPLDALSAVQKTGRDNARLQYDCYHAQRMMGDLTRFIRDHIDMIGHIQIADSPARNQPGTGEINYAFILAELDRLGYDGVVGLEYRPVPSPEASLGWLGEMGYSRR